MDCTSGHARPFSGAAARAAGRFSALVTAPAARADLTRKRRPAVWRDGERGTARQGPPGGRAAGSLLTLLVVALLLAAAIAVRPRGGDGAAAPAVPALVVGDSVVAIAAQAASTGPVRLIGYPGLTPDIYAGVSAPLLAADLAVAGNPRTVVLNWNGNNPRELVGTRLVAEYQAELTAQIRWYLRHGVHRIVLAAAIPSALNDAAKQKDWASPDSARGGAMLGNAHLNEMYRRLAGDFGDAVRYSDRAAVAIHPDMVFNTQLNGRLCVADYIHPTPYCAARYAHALAALAADGS
ncbi:SGNH hydrolase domain-containing protein [Frankia sp. AgKG'84/4]|uniref:SGNH hydrolase domain-containing protein n=1 Tax=Frankia sp. AgKG'84/4 TaxID=573490 RepID=UPI00200EB7EE|nr:SGNH hydrolase domain-containing protein [Frankia sp. AgKG'84/4]MCL9797063.1 hypothetical protein [Frankia sp. AgKG'84/4]